MRLSLLAFLVLLTSIIILTLPRVPGSPTGRKVILIGGTNTYCNTKPCLDETTTSGSSGSVGDTFSTIRRHLKSIGYTDADILVATYSPSLSSSEDPNGKPYSSTDTYQPVSVASTNVAQFLTYSAYNN